MKHFLEIFNMFMLLDQLMKTRSFYLLVLALVLTMPIILFSTLEMAYSQQQQQQQPNDLLTLTEIQNTNLTMGKPIYIESFEVPKSQNNSATSSNSSYSFIGNGILNGMKISAAGSGIVVPRDDGTSSIKGHTTFVSQNGRASYSFEDIANTELNITQRLGAAFFDANATGNLGFLKSKVGIYESYVNNGNSQGIFAMWSLNSVSSR
jgi:hypothetical protein